MKSKHSLLFLLSRNCKVEPSGKIRDSLKASVVKRENR